MKTFRQFYNDTGNVSKVIIYHEGDLLMLKKPNGWELPGGHLKKKESFKKAAKRETFEETRLDIKNINPVYQDSGFVLFLCTNFSGKIELSNEHRKYKWFAPEDLPTKRLTDKTNKALPMILKAIQSIQ